jgi:heat-inducible transcriptional repressor
MIQELSERSREIFRLIVESYCETGTPVGSRFLSKRLDHKLSPASIRNVMADLEEAGLIFAPHTSAGRLPTEVGLRLFVDGLMEVGNLTQGERDEIEARCAARGRPFDDMLGEATQMLSGLSGCAGLVYAPKGDAPLRQIEFIQLGPGRGLVVLVTETGAVENRLIELPLGVSPSALVEAANFLTARLRGHSIGDARGLLAADLAQRRAELDELSAKVVEEGLAVWSGDSGHSSLIVRGQSKLLNDIAAVEDLERIRLLFQELEQREDMLRLAELAEGAEGVRIFIGSENKLFGLTGCSLVVAPFRNSQQRIVGAIGVIGPTRLNYARVIPMVDFTAQVVGRLTG